MDHNLEIIQRHLPVECYAYSSTGQPKPMLSYEGIVQHYFSGLNLFPASKYDLDECWRLMRDMNFEKAGRLFGIYDGPKVSASAHFMVGRGGEILELVPLEFRAFHAGRSQFNGRQYCNNWMLGIENIGSYNDEYTEAQYISNANLCAQLMLEYPRIKIDSITGHEDICVPPGRKQDPGPSFEWDKLRTMIHSLG